MHDLEPDRTTGIQPAAGALYLVPVDPMDLLQCDSCQ